MPAQKFVAVPFDTPQYIRQHVLKALHVGPVQTFGSRREIDAQLQKLKAEGLIRFKAKCRGGNGWELVK